VGTVAILADTDSVTQARTETLRWLNNDPDPLRIEGFRVHYGLTSGSYDTVLDVGPLEPDAGGVYTYNLVVPEDAKVYVAVTSYDGPLQSPISNERVREPDPPPSPPGASDTPASSPGPAGFLLREWRGGAMAVLAAIAACGIFILARKRRRPRQLDAASEVPLLALPETLSDPETPEAEIPEAVTCELPEPREESTREALAGGISDAEDRAAPDDEGRATPDRVRGPFHPAPDPRENPFDEERPRARAPKGATTMATMSRER
jgi:hypothetical protein